MELRQNVDNTNDIERRSPPNELLQPIDDDFFSGLIADPLDDTFFDPNYDYGLDGTDATYTGLASEVGGAAQDPALTRASTAYDGTTLGTIPNSNDASRSDFGQSGQHAKYDAAVNDFQNLFGYNLPDNVNVPDGEQTFSNAPGNSIYPHLHQAQPQFGSGDLTDYPFSHLTFNSLTPGPNLVPFPTINSGILANTTMEDETAHDLASLASPTTDVPRRPRRRRPASLSSHDTSEHTRVKKQCHGCEKAFYTSKDLAGLRCTRCHEKHLKHTAGHTTYIFDPDMTIEHAWRRLYPTITPLASAGDDVESARSNEQDYIRRLIEAVSLPYTSDGSGSKEDQQRAAQQKKLNKKPFDSTQYRDDLVNARIRFLLHIALSYHAGGPSHYDTGGDNAGYGEDRTMKFSERIERIIQLLRFDKDIAMDVIEGRGVTALVHNPNKYERRKRDNKKSNDTKQDLQEKGKQLHMIEAGASGTPTMGQHVDLQSQLLTSPDGLLQDPGSSVSAHASLSALGTPHLNGELPFTGDGGNNTALNSPNAPVRYVPARFG